MNDLIMLLGPVAFALLVLLAFGVCAVLIGMATAWAYRKRGLTPPHWADCDWYNARTINGKTIVRCRRCGAVDLEHAPIAQKEGISNG